MLGEQLEDDRVRVVVDDGKSVGVEHVGEPLRRRGSGIVADEEIVHASRVSGSEKLGDGCGGIGFGVHGKAIGELGEFGMTVSKVDRIET